MVNVLRRRSRSREPRAPRARSGSPEHTSATSTSDSCRDASAIAAISARSADRPCIFQLPATSFFSAMFSPLCGALAARALMRASPPLKRLPSSHFFRKPMLSFFRRVSKSKIGTWIMAPSSSPSSPASRWPTFPISASGNIGFGMGSGTLAKVGEQEVTEREMSDAMQRRLQEVRQQNARTPIMRRIIGDFDPILDALIDQRTLIAFADKYRFPAVEAADRRGDRPDSREPRASTASSASRPIALPCAAAFDRCAGARR